MKAFDKKLRGETLIEIVLAIGLAVMVLFALVVLGSSSIKTGTSSSRRSVAEKLSSSGIEAIRYLRDTNGFDNLSNGCYKIDPDQIVDNLACDTWDALTLADGSKYDRKIEVADYAGSSTMKKVTATSKWVESGGDKQVVISTVLTKWQ